MKKITLLIALCLLLGTGCMLVSYQQKQNNDGLTNTEINAKLKNGELECDNLTNTCEKLGFECKPPLDDIRCMEKGKFWITGTIPEYSQCTCLDPDALY